MSSAAVGDRRPGIGLWLPTQGTLKHLDTQNPVMYMDFPEGRLKFFGTLVFPNTKYMMLKVGTKDILCEDIFGSMVVFSEVWWVGSAEENPEERRLDMPAALLERRVHQEPAEGPESQDPAGKMEEDAEEAEEDDDDKMQVWLLGAATRAQPHLMPTVGEVMHQVNGCMLRRILFTNTSTNH